jgi:hypothetical protein
MKRFFPIALLSVFSCGLHAQAVDATVCDVLQNPASFNGKIVRIKGTVAASLDRFAIEGTGCNQRVNDIWLSYPDGAKAKSGPVAIVELLPAHNYAAALDATQHTPVTLDKSKDFKEFDSLLSAQFKENSMCLACSKNKVTATLVGRIDSVGGAGWTRDKDGKVVSWSGFGNLNAYAARMVLQSVSDVAAQPIDYSKAAAETKSDVVDTTTVSDPVANAHAAAKVFGVGNAAGEQIEKAASVFPKEGEKGSSVIVSYGPANEVPKNEDAKGAQDSPDGVLYICTFNKDRLPGDALTRAFVHSGVLVGQMRSPAPNTEHDGLYETEYRAMATTTFSGVASGQKTLTIYGGILLWNNGWPAADRAGLLDKAMKAELAGEGLMQ